MPGRGGLYYDELPPEVFAGDAAWHSLHGLPVEQPKRRGFFGRLGAFLGGGYTEESRDLAREALQHYGDYTAGEQRRKEEAAEAKQRSVEGLGLQRVLSNRLAEARRTLAGLGRPYSDADVEDLAYKDFTADDLGRLPPRRYGGAMGAPAPMPEPGPWAGGYDMGAGPALPEAPAPRIYDPAAAAGAKELSKGRARNKTMEEGTDIAANRAGKIAGAQETGRIDSGYLGKEKKAATAGAVAGAQAKAHADVQKDLESWRKANLGGGGAASAKGAKDPGWGLSAVRKLQSSGFSAEEQMKIVEAEAADMQAHPEKYPREATQAIGLYMRQLRAQLLQPKE